jgi:hypothetical protein
MATTIFGAGTLVIGPTAVPTDAVECQISQFTISSTANLVPIPATLCVGPSQAAQPSSWALSLVYMQDWQDSAGISNSLFDADGTVLFFLYTPNDVLVPEATGSFYAVAGDYGGVSQDLWVSSDDMPMVEKPVLTTQA